MEYIIKYNIGKIMNFHKSEYFSAAIKSTALYFKLRPEFVEKDYWVTLVLKKLSESEYIDKVIFKGGTSLSKAYQCIERFSEDIDLAILDYDDLSGNQLKNLIKKIEKAVTSDTDLEYSKNNLEIKRGHNRKVFYTYPISLDFNKSDSFSIIKKHIQLEINTFTTPIPNNKKNITTYIADFLRATDNSENNNEINFIKKYNLESFSVNTLSIERTFFEKLASLIRLSYDGEDKLKSKVRHFYDIYKIDRKFEIDLSVDSDNFKLFQEVLEDDANNNIFKGEWLIAPLSNSPLLDDFKNSWNNIFTSYKAELEILSWEEEIPSKEDIGKIFNDKIIPFVKIYDNKND